MTPFIKLATGDQVTMQRGVKGTQKQFTVLDTSSNTKMWKAQLDFGKDGMGDGKADFVLSMTIENAKLDQYTDDRGAIYATVESKGAKTTPPAKKEK